MSTTRTKSFQGNSEQVSAKMRFLVDACGVKEFALKHTKCSVTGLGEWTLEWQEPIPAWEQAYEKWCATLNGWQHNDHDRNIFKTAWDAALAFDRA